jgi:hypothetical protein
MNTFPMGSVMGLILGVALSFAAAFGGLGAFLLVLVLGVLGFLVGRIAESGEFSAFRWSGGRQ